MKAKYADLASAYLTGVETTEYMAGVLKFRRLRNWPGRLKQFSTKDKPDWLETIKAFVADQPGFVGFEALEPPATIEPSADEMESD